jgi:hypothetical protein
MQGAEADLRRRISLVRGSSHPDDGFDVVLPGCLRGGVPWIRKGARRSMAFRHGRIGSAGQVRVAFVSAFRQDRLDMQVGALGPMAGLGK